MRSSNSKPLSPNRTWTPRPRWRCGTARLHERSLAELESSAPYANITTEDLQAQRETGELEREDARLALDQAIATRGAQSVLARKLTRDLEAINERENRLRVELSTRAFAEDRKSVV